MYIVLGVLVGLFCLMFLVTAHEFGHFIMARKNGVEVEEFGICFPPRVLAWRKVDGKWKRIPKSKWKRLDDGRIEMPGEGTILSLNLLPIGGFCQMKDENDASTKKGSFGRASFWGKTKILFGGVAMNWLVAIILLTILALTGMPHFLADQFEVASDTKIVQGSEIKVNDIKKDSPADKAGLKKGDSLVAVVDDGIRKELNTAQDLQNFDNKHAGEKITLCYIRSNKEKCTPVKLNNKNAAYILGIEMEQTMLPLYRSTWSAPIVGIGTTLQITGATFQGLGELLVNLCKGIVMKLNFTSSDARKAGQDALTKASDSVSGPVGIVGILFPAFVQAGLTNLTFLVALISISLAVMNVLPIPALDGGRWLMIAIARLRGKRLEREREEKIVGRAFVVLLVLILIVTTLDVMRLIMR